jgi:hypothetical protein
MATAPKSEVVTAKCPSWRSRKVLLPILGVGALLLAGYLVIGQSGLGL